MGALRELTIMNIVDSVSRIDGISINEIKECLKSFIFFVSADSTEIWKFKVTISDKNDNTCSEFI